MDTSLPPSSYANQQRTWQLFTEAKRRLIESYEKPVRVKALPTDYEAKNNLTLELYQENTKEVFYTQLAETFSLPNEQIDPVGGVFFLDWDTEVNEKSLRDFKSIAQELFFDYEFSPFLEGYIDFPNEAREGFNKFLASYNSFLQEKRGTLTFQFPISEWDTLRTWSQEEGPEELQIAERFGVILSFAPNLEGAITAQFNEAGFGAKAELTLVEHRKHKNYLVVNVRNIALRESSLIDFFAARGFELDHVAVTILAKRSTGEITKLKRQVPGIFQAHLICEFGLRGIAGFVETKYYEVVYEFRALNVAASVWKENSFALSQLYSSLSFLPNLHINLTSQTIFYECSGVEEFDDAIDKLLDNKVVAVNYSPQGFRVKGKAVFDSPMEALQVEMHKVFPATALDTEIIDGGSRLRFRYFLDFKLRIQRSLVFRNFLSDLNNETPYQATLSNDTQLRFLAKENNEAKATSVIDRLQKVLRTDFVLIKGRERTGLGSLKKVSFPHLHFSFPSEMLDAEREALIAVLSSSEGLSVAADLNGEKEKVARLDAALEKLSNPKIKLPNPAARAFFFDASQAVPLDYPAELETGSKTWNEVVEHSLLNLNDSQTSAVISTLLARDLALVQGPPGTGKSSAISQIIWHHIRRQQRQRILLTSETNMAVDNAIEKLENNHSNLVKPLRIGKEGRLEKEGSRYTLSKIEQWRNTPAVDTQEDLADNAVQKWMHIISRRALNGDMPEALLTKWQSTLGCPEQGIKSDFATTYLNHVNVVASTGSSIGDVNTKGRWTSFYQQYLQVFDRQNFDRFFDQQRLAKGIAKISFDVVVMDEASKATPPEIALVLVYAKKAILIGDHRQLPPMLDQGDFRTTLIDIGEKKLASQFTREDAETSHFERLFRNPSLDASLVSRFNTQYRMHPHINNVIQQFYVEDGGLHCGILASDADDQNLSNPASRHHGFSFPGFIKPDQHLVWVDVDEPEMLDITSRLNWSEVRAVRAVLTCLEKAQGFAEFQASQRKDEEKEVGIITFYGKQRSLLQEVADEFAHKVPTRVRTVDKFQGMERNVVIVSMVRSNKLAASRYQEPDLSLYADNGGYPRQPDLGFAEFPNRLNVALSRAKRLLIIVGNSSHFAQNDCYRRVYEQVCTTGHVLDFKSLLALID